MITYTHDSSIILVSIVVSLVAAFTGLALTNKIGTLPVARRKALIVMSAFVLGGGIWSMHFVAMLAHRFTVPVHYDLLQTLWSALIAVLVVGLALLILHFAPRTPRVLTGAGLLLGAGIVAMHFIGMLGMRGVIPLFSNWAVFAAAIVAALMGVKAIWVSYGSRTNKRIVLGGLWFGFSVVFVHFTAMAGTTFQLDPSYQAVSVVLEPDTLAIVVTVTAFVICGTFLLAASTFLTSQPEPVSVPEGALVSAPASSAADSAEHAASLHDGSAESSQASSTKAAVAVTDASSSDTDVAVEPEAVPDSERECSATLLRASTPQETTPSGDAAGDKERTVPPGAEGPVRIPFERNKHIEFVLSSQVAVVRADGRYTHLHTQEGVRFCPWSIAEAEKRLAGESFFRSHRSYLINLHEVAVFEKKRDAGLCKFNDYPQLTSVPVSRARVASLQELLGL